MLEKKAHEQQLQQAHMMEERMRKQLELQEQQQHLEGK